MRNFLLEIGVEELPAKPLLKELKNIPTKWQKALLNVGIKSDFEFFYTPRRLSFLHKNFSSHTLQTQEILYGPSLEAAFQNGVPTAAANGFAKKCGCLVGDLKQTDFKGKTVLTYTKINPSISVESLMAEVVLGFLKDLKFGKEMRWADLKEGFIRPIKWITAIHAEKTFDFCVFGVNSGNKTYGHRSYSYEPQKISIENYEQDLEKMGVIVSHEKRKEKILSQIAQIEKTQDLKVEKDAELLDELVAITEHPNLILGEFDKEFLALPPEVIQTSMKENQRYFSVSKNSKLSNHFVAISNSLSLDLSLIKNGNQRVLKPRLKDAEFFYQNDLAKNMDFKGLEKVTFTKELGSLAQKVQREEKIAEILCEILNLDPTQLIQAVRISKNDLLSEMVYEFTNLQGIMGEYYAKNAGLSAEISKAIKEQYEPLGENLPLPSSSLGALLSITTKLDNLLGLFSTNKIPTGSKDPLSLRRASLGIIKIIIAKNYEINISDLINKTKHLYKEFDTKILVDFFYERLYGVFSCNPSIVKSVINSKQKSLSQMAVHIEVLAHILQEKSVKSKFSTFKRVANIVSVGDNLSVDEGLFAHQSEKALYKNFMQINQNGTKEHLEALFNLGQNIDEFFENVLINDENIAVKQNRQNLLGLIYNSFLGFADLKEISL